MSTTHTTSTSTTTAGQRSGHRDDGDDQAVEVAGAERAGLEVIIADPRRGHPRGTQGEHGAGEFQFPEFLCVFLWMMCIDGCVVCSLYCRVLFDFVYWKP